VSYLHKSIQTKREGVMKKSALHLKGFVLCALVFVCALGW